jgi:hypothetical protein
MTQQLPALPDEFRRHALAMPDEIDRFLAGQPALDQVKQQMNGGAAYLQLARQIKADTEVINAIQLGRLKLIARWGVLNPAAPPGERGQGRPRQEDNPEEKSTSGREADFADATVALYRKVAANQDRIQAYRDEVVNNRIGEELTASGFVRFATGTEKAGRAAHISANSGVPEWYTPAVYIEAVRVVLGAIGLDPASSLLAQKTIQATRFFTLENDGLAHDWRGRVFLNPPYTSGLVDRFVDKLCVGVARQDITAAILLVNNATDTRWLQRALQLANALCFPAGRIRFYGDEGEKGAPLQGQVFLYFGPAWECFVERFAHFGAASYWDSEKETP